jgi:murein DD-endopeptidase MepM/ murein hydrolase activator NlpD
MSKKKQQMKVGFFIVAIVVSICLLFTIIYFQLVSSEFVMPVKGANRSSYSQKSFWAYPWGESGHHKGVDIFAKRGTSVVSSTHGVVIFTGVLKRGGNAILIIGPKMKMYYYAHLDSIMIQKYSIVKAGDPIGKVGNTGNAKTKPYHLHFSIRNVFPFRQRGYQNPTPLLNNSIL